jgi:hypothetical protein
MAFPRVGHNLDELEDGHRVVLEDTHKLFVTMLIEKKFGICY